MINNPAQAIELPLTDLGNAQRLVSRNSHSLRYCYPWRKWLVYDGQRWAIDDTGEAARRATDTARWTVEEARNLARVAQTQEDSERNRLLTIAEATLSWARKSESSKSIRSMLELSKSRPGIAVRPDQLDADGWALNVINGTLDLRTGKLRKHDPGDLLTKLCPTVFNRDAAYEQWDSFLERILPDEQLRAFLQRAAGYSLIGVTTEEKLFFPFGPTATGKTTFLRAISTAMGDYAAVADFETFLKKEHRGPGNDIARLAGRRLVMSVEVDDGAKLAEGLVQQITGGDRMTARHLYSEFFEFVPTFTLWLASNSRPRVRDDNSAIWRRIVQIPFVEQISEGERDDGLKSALCDLEIAGPAVLAWMVKGCLDWQQMGLQVPQQVRDMTADYRTAMDPLGEFLEERCVLYPEAKVKNPDLREAYLQWAKENNVRRPLSAKAIGQRLKAKEGVSQVNLSGVRVWNGIRLSPEEC